MVFLSVLLIALAVAPQPPAPSEVTGIVRDPSGAAVRDADVKLIAPQQRVAAAARTGDEGTFTLTVKEPGDYLVVVSAPGFNEVRSPVQIPTSQQLEFTLGLPILHEDVSVTAVIDRVEERTRLAQPVNIIDADEIALRAKSAVVEAASEEVGLHVQRTSPVMSASRIGFTETKPSAASTLT